MELSCCRLLNPIARRGEVRWLRLAGGAKPARIMHDLADHRHCDPHVEAEAAAILPFARGDPWREGQRQLETKQAPAPQLHLEPIGTARQRERETEGAEALHHQPIAFTELARKTMAAKISSPALDAILLGEGDVKRH